MWEFIYTNDRFSTGSPCGFNAIARNFSTVLNSPGWPGLPPFAGNNNLSCVWRLVAPAGQKISLSFSYFGLGSFILEVCFSFLETSYHIYKTKNLLKIIKDNVTQLSKAFV